LLQTFFYAYLVNSYLCDTFGPVSVSRNLDKVGVPGLMVSSISNGLEMYPKTIDLKVSKLKLFHRDESWVTGDRKEGRFQTSQSKKYSNNIFLTVRSRGLSRMILPSLPMRSMHMSFQIMFAPESQRTNRAELDEYTKQTAPPGDASTSGLKHLGFRMNLLFYDVMLSFLY
jgi:hypothetical protein